MTRLLHLNGPPGIGKSTLARRFAEEHPGTLNCDVDVLRTLIGGWHADFAGAGALIRPAALAMIEAHLRESHDVVFPQLLTDPAELTRFEETATNAGARFVERVLMDTPAAAVARFHRRGSNAEDPWHEQVRSIVAAEGGDARLEEHYSALERLLADRPDAVLVESREGAIDETYRSLIETLD